MSAHNLFPERVETQRLTFERFNHATVDVFEFYDFVTTNQWQEAATEHMPWFCFRHLGEVVEFFAASEQRWTDGESARYLLRATEDDEILGTTAYYPELEPRRASSDIVLSRDHWGSGYGLERASVFIEMTFEMYDLDAYYTTCAATNDPSRRMIEKAIEKYRGRHEGLLRQHSPRPNGDVTDQHRFTILQEEYENATDSIETMQFTVEW